MTQFEPFLTTLVIENGLIYLVRIGNPFRVKRETMDAIIEFVWTLRRVDSSFSLCAVGKICAGGEMRPSITILARPYFVMNVFWEVDVPILNGCYRPYVAKMYHAIQAEVRRVYSL